MNKAVIFSENSDYSTSVIMKWMFFLGKDVVRINRDDSKLSVERMNNDEILLNTSFGNVNICKTDICWFRRAGSFSIVFLKPDERNSNIRSFEIQEQKSIHESIIYWVMNNCKYIANPFTSDVSKIDVLLKVQSVGINCPEWIITDNKRNLIKFAEIHKTLVIKTFNTLNYTEGNTSFKNLTKLLTKREINTMPDKFEPLFFQKYIEKKYELRAFFFEDKFFTMAIISQNDDKTAVDFRNYNNEKPNRRIPFQLPYEYETKLKLLSQSLSLDTGSFDILVDKNDNYYFLEVNPVGQFGMTSIPCNYNIEKFIAETLIDKL
ncbi:MAG: grasp-with-spasm system ATP-grasp peptide maturase [Prevotellaceae bacterium]|jgi:ATP-GRASP peptide maturase of grasp-with-spasm system|nr:grasp-with-spasm system ATP-grasp peptide maturase [Prevotellaceae bacterium]